MEAHFRGSAAGDLFPAYAALQQTPQRKIKRPPPSPLSPGYPSAFKEKNESFFVQSAESADDKVIAAFEHCAEIGALNLSGQGLEGPLPDSIIRSLSESCWHEKWWEAHAVRKIDVSHNNLTSLPAAVAKLVDVDSFLAHCNNLTAVPPEMFTDMPNLQELNLRRNQVRHLKGSAVKEARSLVSLVVSNNKLSKLPDELFQLSTLEVLEAASNEIESLPDIPWHSSRLIRLDISNNSIGPALPESLRGCELLRELNAAHNQLKGDLGDFFNVATSHGWATSLTSLNINHNLIGPDLHLSNLANLDTLMASCNVLSRIILTNINNLSILIATNNKLTEFPAVSPKLSTVDLTNNCIDRLPTALGFVKSLRRAIFTGNPLLGIRPDLHQGHAEALKDLLRKRIEDKAEEDRQAALVEERYRSELASALRVGHSSRHLNLEQWGFTALPRLPPRLLELNLANNRLTADALLAAILSTSGEATVATVHLCKLCARENKLSEGRASAGLVRQLICGLRNLEDLELQHNSLSDFAIGFSGSGVTPCASSKISTIDLSDNALIDFPTQLLISLPSLETLRISTNQVQSLGDVYRAAGTGLRKLDVSQNFLTELPAWLPGALLQLTELDVSNNHIADLPCELGFWKSLKEIALGGNPLKKVRQAVLAKGWEALASWLQDRMPEGSCKVVPLPDQEADALESDTDAWLPTPSRKPVKIQPTPTKRQLPPPSPPANLTFTPGSTSGVHWPWPNDSFIDKSKDVNPEVLSDSQAEVSTPARARRVRQELTAESGSADQESQDAEDCIVRRSTIANDPTLLALRAQVLALQQDVNDSELTRVEKAEVNHRLRMKKVELHKAEANFKEEVIERYQAAILNTPVADHPGDVTWAALPGSTS